MRFRAALLLLPFDLLFSVTADAVERPELAPIQGHVDVVGDIDHILPATRKAAVDTTWIATWNFEGCDDSGWVRSDNRVLNDGNIYWQVNSSFDGIADIDAEAAVLGDAAACDTYCGYGNDWYQAIRLRYVGNTWLSFDYLVDAEPASDFLQVETDSACASFSRVDYDIDPNSHAIDYRDVLWQITGFDTVGTHVDSLLLGGYATADTHCVYIAFFSDGACDPLGLWAPSMLGVGAVVDNIVLQGSHPLAEDFSSFTPSTDVQFQNVQDSTPFGTWSRLYSHISDNDLCTENTSCAWLSTDHTTPTIANDPSMSFGPDGFVVRNWLDNVVIGPWVSLSSTSSEISTLFQMRRFGGNNFGTSRIVQNWSVRGRRTVANSESPAPGDSIDCVSSWGHVSSWNSVGQFAWRTETWDMTSLFDPTSEDIQMRIRTSDWQYIAGFAPPSPYRPGPGPFWDRLRIGRQNLTGPVLYVGIDDRYQAQDAAPNDPAFESGPNYSPAAGGDIFGTTAFSQSADHALSNSLPNLIVGDSITCIVEDVLGHGGLTVEVHFAIAAGPHAGKAPAPYTVQPNGFFVVPADSAFDVQVFNDKYFVDLDDTYFRGGDVLLYYWWATDGMGGTASAPAGLTAVPASVAEAEAATGGLLEVSFLPNIDWDPAYLARIQADAHGDLDPTPAELANSSQANCILYYQIHNSRRHSGDWNRSSFMYTLDKLGYRGMYDVYDHTGLGDTNNHLGSRMSAEQARGYSLLVYDTEGMVPSGWLLPTGSPPYDRRIDMGQWFQDWNSLSGSPNPDHTLWILGANIVEEEPDNPLFLTDMAASFVSSGQHEDPNPDLFGVADFTNHASCQEQHIGEQFALHGGCNPDDNGNSGIRNYDDISATGTGVLTHRYGKGAPGSAGAVVMNANAGGFTTILSTFAWSDINSSIGQTPEMADEDLLSTVLACALPVGCQQSPTPTDTGEPPVLATPARTTLRQNTPNPFNPVTTISFDLARDGRVTLRIYDVAGRLVCTLADELMTAGFDRQLTWNGHDDAGRRVSSGIYLYRLVAGDMTATRKMLMMK